MPKLPTKIQVWAKRIEIWIAQTILCPSAEPLYPICRIHRVHFA
jgi:hypothetical protein